ncbi:hypothetical protein ACFPKZ_43835 [Streptosporangium amethystogenes subsp. fukuiense]|uniref:hypothetical protein n=1 Tax=Streptosporangium amethystogenes TaxID=2002 RepID=UPI0033759F1D
MVESRDHKAIVIGSVEGFEQGRDIYDIEGDPYPDKRVVMHVRVDSTIKDNGIVSDGRVYVDLDQGAYIKTESPAGLLTISERPYPPV